MDNILQMAVLVGVLIFGAVFWVKFVKPNKQIMQLIDVFDDALLDAIIFVSSGYVDMTEYRKKADERKEKGEMYIDPRMLYVMDKIEIYATKYGLDFEFDEVLPRAERLYRELKADGFFGNDE